MIMIMSMIIVDDFDDVDVNLEDGTWSAWRPMASISSYEQSVEDEVKYDHIIFQLIVTSNTLYIASAINLGEKLLVSHVEYSRPALCVREVFAAF